MNPGDLFAQGRYTLLRKLRSSGMAEVWLARQHGTEGFAKDVVLKRILPHLAEDEKLISMFLDEGRIAANLNHPNVVQIFDLGNDGVDYYIAMEYIRGYDLEQIQEQLRKRNVAFPVEYALRIIADTCLGLDYAHDCKASDGTPMNVVHRDVSPQNILVSETGVVKLIDFGIAKARTSSTRTQVGHTKGKICYMSPEQMMARDLDRRSDIFSAGVVLYESLLSLKPFDGDNLLACFHKLMKEGIILPRQVRRDIHPELEHVMMTALAKDRDERYPTAGAFRRALEQFLRGQGISVGPEHLSDFLKWLFTPNDSTQVALDLPYAVAQQNGAKPLSSPSVPAGNGFGTEDRVAAHAGRVTASGAPQPQHAGRQTSPAGTPPGPQGFPQGPMAPPHGVSDPNVPHSGFFQGAPAPSAHYQTGPSLGALAGSDPALGGIGVHSTGPSLGVPMEFNDDDELHYRGRKKRSSGGVWIYILLLFVLAAGGVLTTHFLGVLPGFTSASVVTKDAGTPTPPRIATVKQDAGTPDVRKVPVRSKPDARRTKPVKRRAKPDKRKSTKRTKPVARKVERRPPPKRRKKRRVRGWGYVIIDTDIRARVSIDGKLNYIRVPLLKKKKIKAGWHRLRFISPAGPKVKRVYITPNKTKDIYVRLRSR